MAKTQGKPKTWPEASHGLNPFARDTNRQRYLERVAPDLYRRQRGAMDKFGAFCGTRLDAQATYSDQIAPATLRHVLDRAVAPTKRQGAVALNPEYRACQQEMYRHGVVAKCFDQKSPEPHMLAFMAQYDASYSDISTGCPLAMTHPVAMILQRYAPPAVRDAYLPQFLRTDGKTMVGGTAATEWAGGSDLRGNTKTRAVVKDKATGESTIDGRNYFTSAMGFDSWGIIKTVLVEKPDGTDGVGLVFIPRFTDQDWDREDAQRTPNNVVVSWLKEKMGTRGLATAEIELEGARGYLLADGDNGLRVMMEALGCSRVHNAMAAAGVMHRVYVEAMCWTAHRRTFDDTLVNREDQQEDLLRLKTEWLGGAALAFEAARSFDEALADKKQVVWSRLVTAIAKYHTAAQVGECTELGRQVIGGTGYTKDHPMERIYRDTAVLAVWEGGKNIQAREILGILQKGGADAFMDRLQKIYDGLPGDTMSFEKARLLDLRQGIGGALQDLAKADAAAHGLAGQRYMKTMAKILTYALLCEEAAAEHRLYNDVTKQLVARSYYGDHFAVGPMPSLEKSDLHKHFDAVAKGLPIRAAQLTRVPAP